MEVHTHTALTILMFKDTVLAQIMLGVFKWRVMQVITIH